MTKGKLGASERNALPDSDFAVPGKRKLPIEDPHHAANAASRVNQAKGLTPAEKASANKRIANAEKKFGMHRDSAKE